MEIMTLCEGQRDRGDVHWNFYGSKKRKKKNFMSGINREASSECKE